MNSPVTKAAEERGAARDNDVLEEQPTQVKVALVHSQHEHLVGPLTLAAHQVGPEQHLGGTEACLANLQVHNTVKHASSD